MPISSVSPRIMVVEKIERGFLEDRFVSDGKPLIGCLCNGEAALFLQTGRSPSHVPA